MPLLSDICRQVGESHHLFIIESTIMSGSFSISNPPSPPYSIAIFIYRNCIALQSIRRRTVLTEAIYMEHLLLTHSLSSDVLVKDRSLKKISFLGHPQTLDDKRYPLSDGAHLPAKIHFNRSKCFLFSRPLRPIHPSFSSPVCLFRSLASSEEFFISFGRPFTTYRQDFEITTLYS